MSQQLDIKLKPAYKKQRGFFIKTQNIYGSINNDIASQQTATDITQGILKFHI